MATENTIWPSTDFPDNVKELLAHFFKLVESKDEEVGKKLAEEVFTPTGMTQSGVQKFVGTEGLYFILNLVLLFISHQHYYIALYHSNFLSFYHFFRCHL